MSEKDLKQRAEQMFVRDEEELLAEELDRMEGWFELRGNHIRLAPEFSEAPKAAKYLGYLLGAYVADFTDVRESPIVEHAEVDDHFGWDSGGTAKHQASSCSSYLTDEGGEKQIAPGKIDDAIDYVEGKLPS